MGGYRWWYADALSDDGRFGCTVIAFIGSVFSPYYAAARRAAGKEGALADPVNHVAVNVALYGLAGPGWAMTERRRGALARTAQRLAIGPSALEWQGDALVIGLDEITVPRPRRLRGRIVLTPSARLETVHAIDAHGRHRWQPMAPCARVEVAFDRPGWGWSGHGYLDSNDGDEPLEDGFARWEWSRALLTDGSAAVLYDATMPDGATRSLARRYDPSGTEQVLAMPPRAPLPKGLWRMDRVTHADVEAAPKLLRALEDSPFYCRSLIETRIGGEPVTAMHESLSLDRFRQRWVQALLPFRMPRTPW